MHLIYQICPKTLKALTICHDTEDASSIEWHVGWDYSILETLVEDLSDLEMLAVEGEEHEVYNSEFIFKVYSHIAEKQKYISVLYLTSGCISREADK